MSCRESLRLLQGYVDGELDLAGALALEEHLQSCNRCKAERAALRALRAALSRHAEVEAAPESLRHRLQSWFAQAAPGAGIPWRWGAALAAPGVVALALAAWLAFSPPGRGPLPASAPLARVVYHVSSSATPAATLRNLANHLNAQPGVSIVVVAHNEGVDFLLRGAQDETGQPVEPAVRRFLERGVEFRICNNTLERRRIDAGEVIPAARLVPSGVAEISRLQSEEGYAYMRL